MKDRTVMPILFPLLAVVTIVVYAGGLGIIFIYINETPLGAWAVVILGLALVIGVPTAAALIQRMLERR